MLQKDTDFNTADVKPVGFRSALKPVILQMDSSGELKHSVRHKVAALVTKQRMNNRLTKMCRMLPP